MNKMTDYTIQIIDQNTGNRNAWNLNEIELSVKLLNLLDTQKRNEVIVIEKR